MSKKLFILFLFTCILLIQFSCAPSIRSAKIQPEFSADGVLLGTMFSASATDELGNDETDSEVDFNLPIPFDVKFRYGWERDKKEGFGFELSGGLDGQFGAYLELPGTEEFHWGFGAETNIWILGLSRETDDDDVSEFISDHNYHVYLMAGYFPSPKFELSAGIKYQPFLGTFLEEVSNEDIDSGSTLPVTYLLDVRYLFSENFGLIGGAEFFDLSFSGDGQQEVSLTGGYLYIGLTYR